MGKILLIQSRGFDGIKKFFKQVFSERIGDFLFSDSFDHALEIIPKGELLVITSNIFHDQLSDHRDSAKRTIPDSEKNGNVIAKKNQRNKSRSKSLCLFRSYSKMGLY